MGVKFSFLEAMNHERMLAGSVYNIKKIVGF